MVRLNATLGSVLQRGGYAEPEGSQRALACCDYSITAHHHKKSHPTGDPPISVFVERIN